jgi:hypothetical protein
MADEISENKGMIESINPIFQQKCEYADLEYLSEAIYEELSSYAVGKSIDLTDVVLGEFEVIVNWKKR